jgi:hypothetical protein
MQIHRYLYTVIWAKVSLFLSLSNEISISHTNQMPQYVSLFYCKRTDSLLMECILSCRRAARHTCKHSSQAVVVIRRIQVDMSMCIHVRAYIGRVCDEMALFLSHRLAHIHMYVFGGRKVYASMSWMRLFLTVDQRPSRL